MLILEKFYTKQTFTNKSPASLTKVMTLAIIFDALEKNKIRLTDMWPVSKHAAAQSPVNCI